ncbi:SIS domain-containing protein [Dactylosporangium roseum]|uniref:SIS domain-containing protein n=1 Tax=Dactylosporangium roseum TaxID=47989 RepID=A0ABY5Z8W0_9ACTN|nr:SIS domain-containing protein [Dactylosporangium roseum]UWZ38530.1 SIS domain-containing protein [Dactylosporangium roseum]
MAVTALGYVSAIRSVIDRIDATQVGNVNRAAEHIVTALQAGGILQAFGTGHSEAVPVDFAGRAGGLVPTNKILLRDLVVCGGQEPRILENEKLERDPRIAAPPPEDAFVMAAQSGINGGIVEMALLIEQRGHKLIAITSVEHTERVAPRHPSGRRLADVADVVLDNGAPYGDALLSLDSGGAVCPVSSVTGALIAQRVIAEVVRRIEAAGEVAPVYLSANVPGGDEYNNTLESRYAGRVRRTA